MQLVVGFDGSDAAKRAFDVALDLAGVAGRVTVVSAHIDRGVIPESMERELRDEMQRGLDTLAAAALERGRLVETMVLDGHPQLVLAAVADELRADVVVVGRSNAGLGAALLGGVSAAIVSGSSVPVLVVP